ncbi:Iduronate sulfatase [Planctomycetales bacterium 10988]|nr:Iduronate sulfatase [Planctomycetales bacterium 10988]
MRKHDASTLRRTLAGLLLLAISLGIPAMFLAPAAAAEKRPNVLMIAVDDLRPELGCYGVDRAISPNIDRLAESGVLFERAYVQQSVCGPSRISLLSGLRPDSTGVYKNNTMLCEARPDVVSLPRQFNLHGYHTVSLGKIYHHPEDDPAAWSEPVWRPFGISWGWRNYRRPENRQRVIDLYSSVGREKKETFPLGRMKGPAAEASPLPDNVYPDGLTADMATRTLQMVSQEEEPFFMAVGFYKPHLPFACPQKYWDLFDPAQIELPEHNQPPQEMPEVAFRDSNELRQYDGIAEQGEISDEEARHLIHGYLACVAYMDAQVGRVLNELDRLGLAEDTIVVLWGDHGWHLQDLGIWAKSTNFEVANRIPLIVRAPEGVAGRTTPSLIEAVDIYPTLCELAGLPLPEHLEGTSFAPLLSRPRQPWKSAVFSQYPRPDSGKDQVMGMSMRTNRYRFTRWSPVADPQQVTAYELYDHQEDPNETENIAVQLEERNPEKIEELNRQLLAGWKHAKPQAPIVKKNPRKQENPKSTFDAVETEEGFLPLFNGVDLSGWDGMPGSWRVKDGAIWSTGLGKERNWLIWRGFEAGDFELRLKFRFEDGNSGVQVRSKDLGHWQIQGYQVEVAEQDVMGLWHHSLMSKEDKAEFARKYLATAGQVVTIDENAKKETEQVAEPAEVQKSYREGEWNEMTVIAKGPRIIQKINGVTYADLTDREKGFSSRSGWIALQDHGKGTVVGFKDLRLKFLPKTKK